MLVLLLLLPFVGYGQRTTVKTSTMTSSQRELSCKLTTPALQKRRETIIAGLKEKIKERKELPDGFSFRFEGTDEMIDTLTDFIKTERLCCDFFDFSLKASGDASSAWLTLTGPEGAKEFMTAEMGL